jgi:hypothetical protein
VSVDGVSVGSAVCGAVVVGVGVLVGTGVGVAVGDIVGGGTGGEVGAAEGAFGKHVVDVLVVLFGVGVHAPHSSLPAEGSAQSGRHIAVALSVIAGAGPIPEKQVLLPQPTRLTISDRPEQGVL